MVAVAPPADDAADLMKNLSLDSKTKSSKVLDPVKNFQPSVDTGNRQIQPNNQTVTPLFSDYMDPTLAYFPNGYPSTAYYYGGYDGTTYDWEEYSRYLNSAGVDLAHGVYGYGYGHGYGYAPYGAYSSASSAVSHDGQLYGAQHHQYPSPYGSVYSDPQTKNNGFTSKTQSHLTGPSSLSGMSTSTGYVNKTYPNKIYTQYVNTYRSGYGYDTVDKSKTRVQANGFPGYNSEYNDGLNELNRGPRGSRTTKNQKPSTPVTVKSQDISSSVKDGGENDSTEVKEVNVTPGREQYNKEDFPETYTDSKFYIIKSYSEDDVHKSIKYNMWASTQTGNKKLDAAYREAQQKSEKCPVFLFFSVNTSGQFVGVAEMVGPVDFTKSLEFWQQDKWIGCFPVKWHIVKDLPNGLLRHIILENNENKPVTNSRDTQEVNLVQGLQMIKIFKDHCSKQCVLDDFEFYEERQKRIQEKKAKQQFQKQAWEGKHLADKQKTKEVNENMPNLVNEVKLSDAAQDDDDPKPEDKKVIVNGSVKM